MTTLFGFVGRALRRPVIGIGERLAGKTEMYRRMLDGHAEKMRVSMPAKVLAWNAGNQTITAQPLIREKVIDRATGAVQWMTLPPIPDVPVQFPQAGDFVLTMPITPGDEVILVCQDMCMDSWWHSGGIQNWNMRRRHNLSDAIAIPGINSLPNKISDIADDAAELRSKDGEVKVQIKADQINLINGATQKVELHSDRLTLTFDANNKIELAATGISITGTLKINGTNYLSHKHAGVTTGPGTSGTVIP